MKHLVFLAIALGIFLAFVYITVRTFGIDPILHPVGSNTNATESGTMRR